MSAYPRTFGVLLVFRCFAIYSGTELLAAKNDRRPEHQLEAEALASS